MPPLRSLARAGVLAALTLGLLPATSAAASSPNTAALQVALKALHHYGGPIDGIRGPRTTHGLRVFQKTHHLTVDGIVGRATLRALGWRGRAQLGQRAVRRGTRGWDVVEVQFLLRRRGFSPGTIDGGFGHGTDSALHRFQRSVSLSADGVAGSHTIQALIHGASSHPSGSGRGSGSPSGPVRFLRPVNAPITSPFGMRWGRMHTGVDFGAPYGASVDAAGRGTVYFAGWNSGGYGYLVIIQHRLGFQSWYAHLSSVSVHSGQAVTGGTHIGNVGATGHATGPHLHFEVRHNGVPINPVPYLLDAVAKVIGLPRRDDPDGCAPKSGFESNPRTARLTSCK
jgi:peptidoglycan hydrolase-like protein with peptidoglycan-binding domain